jgi:(1->4)-alpha-D-glucan 1-alpha-D-glucosylmutase
MQKRMATSAQSLNATATHDTKRGEDARIRLNLLSEMPEEWITHVEFWRRVNSSLISNDKAGLRAPSVNDEYFIYQSMIGGFPDDMQVKNEWITRLQEYIVKVVREAKVVSTWSDPNEDYENGCKEFIRKTLADHHPFLDDFLPFAKRVATESTMYSMGQLLLKITAPGIPDIYQGCELYDLSYVDPDNRRPVDYGIRQVMLSEIKKREKAGFDALEDWLNDNYTKGGGKLFTGYKMLNFRKNHPKLFEEGEYIPVEVSGSILCFCRKWQNQRLVVVIPLGTTRKNQSRPNLPDIMISLSPDFPKEWTNVFTNEVCTSTSGFPLGKLVEKFPIAALFAEEKS